MTDRYDPAIDDALIKRLPTGVLIGGDFLGLGPASALVYACRIARNLYKKDFNGSSSDGEFHRKIHVNAYRCRGMDGIGEGEGNVVYRNGDKTSYPFCHRLTESKGLEIGLKRIGPDTKPGRWYREDEISIIADVLDL